MHREAQGSIGGDANRVWGDRRRIDGHLKGDHGVYERFDAVTSSEDRWGSDRERPQGFEARTTEDLEEGAARVKESSRADT